MNKPLCVSVFVFGNYTRFIPYYVYSVLKSYPEYYVKVFTQEPLSRNENKCLNLIRRKLSDHFEIKENYFGDHHITDAKVGKAMRFLIPRREYKDYENVYIGDVDFLIIKESPSLLEGHLAHCNKINLPYSNQIRPHSKRLTGLHFFRVRPYYKTMQPMIKHYRKEKEILNKELQPMGTNEEFLYQLMKDGFGFGKMEDHPYRPHHGFHLGIFRTGDYEKKFNIYLKRGSSEQIVKTPTYPLLRKQLLDFYSDPLFQRIREYNPLIEIKVLHRLLRRYHDCPK
ncbi:hypothetical protein [Paenibacillus lautus]|uniref:hypothetical protein n=1 Tax=Paenibacillus lautus TaxID=1401 RepID=UPI001C100EF9|nr:hypothetical protein [Paenibacillus lautus]MBU5350607.1 hypothetical protein [Paenibacillus lautus]